MGTSMPPLLVEMFQSVPGAPKVGHDQWTTTFNELGAKDQYSAGKQATRLIDSMAPGLPSLFRRFISEDLTKLSEGPEAQRKREIEESRAMFEECSHDDCNDALKQLYEFGDAPFFRRVASRIPFKDIKIRVEQLKYYRLGQRVIQYLGDLHDKEAVSILVPMLFSCRPRFVRETADSLVKIGAHEAVPDIVEAIFHHRRQVEEGRANRYSVLVYRSLVRALAKLGDESVVPLLKDIIWGGGPVRPEPCSAKSQVATFGIRPERWRVVTPMAILGLGRIAGPEALLPLLKKQKDDDREDWRQKHVITQRNLQAMAHFVSNAEVRNELLALMEKSPCPRIRWWTVEALSFKRALEIKSVRKAIIARLGDDDCTVRWGAIDALSNENVVVYDDVKQALKKTSFEDPCEGAREKASKALSR